MSDQVLTVAIRLRMMRNLWHISQKELAARAELSRGIVSLIENGNDDTVKVSTLRALSYSLDTPMTTWFIADDEWLAWYNQYSNNAHWWPRL